jgi:hypothetical protein
MEPTWAVVWGEFPFEDHFFPDSTGIKTLALDFVLIWLDQRGQFIGYIDAVQATIGRFFSGLSYLAQWHLYSMEMSKTPLNQRIAALY